MQKILIADDEAKIRRIIRDFLTAKGFETVEAEDGAQALRVFSENSDIALAVLDIMMPEMNGWEVCRKIRETSDVPVIFLTARGEEFDELECFECGADDFITRLPDGYNTQLTNNGANLSQGQRQLLSIARAAVADPPALILDEATSALDNESEHIVQQSLEKLAKGRTVFTIAHRLTTIKGADCIWVLTEKGVEEQGSHTELIAKGGLYAHLFAMYTSDR